MPAPKPNKSLATLRPELGASFEDLPTEAEMMGMIGLEMLPPTDVMVQAGNIGRIPLSQLLQNPDTRRMSGSGYSRGTYTFEDFSYATAEHGHEEPIDDRDANIYGNYFVAEQVATRRARNIVMRDQEIRAVGKLLDTSVFNATAVATPWSTLATATPVDDVLAAMQRVWLATGLWPNVIAMNRFVFQDVRRCEQVIDLSKAQNFQDVRPREMNEGALAAVFDIEEVKVAGAPQNAAAPGLATSIAHIWGNDKVFIGRIARSNDIREPCVGRTFHYTEDGSSIGGTVETYRAEEVRGDVVRVRNDTDENIIYAEAGEILTGVKA